MTLSPLLILVVALAQTDAGTPQTVSVNELATRVGASVVRLGVWVGEEEEGNGTGFFIRADGIVVTNHHVVQMVTSDNFYAVFPDGKRKKVKGTLADDEDHDIAIVKIEGDGYPVLELAASEDVRVGEQVFIIGSSHGLDQSLGVGVISALRPDGFPDDWKKAYERRKEKVVQGPLVQHTAVSAGGSSGSALVDINGRVVGVHHSEMRGSGIKFGAHVDALRALIAKTDLNAAPRSFRPDVTKNLVISALVFAGIAALFVVVPGVDRMWRRRKGQRQARN